MLQTSGYRCHLVPTGMFCADAVSMWTVPIPLRPAGQAFQVICMHAFGDVPLPPMIGVIQGDACCAARTHLYADGVLW